MAFVTKERGPRTSSVLSPQSCRPVEAQGIEPWSECGSGTASTCVDPSSSVSPTRRGTGRFGDYLLMSRLARRRTTLGQPGFAIRSTAPRAGSANRRCDKRAFQLSLRSQRQVIVGVWLFPSGLARDLDLGTQQFLLPTRRSRSPPGVSE